MAQPKLNPAKKKIFVNRETPLAIFNEAATAIPDKGQLLRVFYGMGGQGKTALCNHIRDHYIPKHKHLKFAHLDLAIGHVSDGVKLLIKLRNGFAQSGVATGVFDLALAIVWETTRKEETYPVLVKPLIARSQDVVGDATVDGVKSIFEFANDTPGLGAGIKLLTKYGFKKGHKQWLAWSRQYMKAMVDENGKLKPGDQLVELLPWFLAKDLNHYRSKKQKHHFVILVDEYETLLGDLVMSRAAKDGNFDGMLQSLISETEGLLVVFFLRGELPWGQDADWRGELKKNQHDIFGLKDKDARDWLVQEGITETELQDAMIESGRATDDAKSLVCPLFLELQVKNWQGMVARELAITPDDFRIDGKDMETRRRQLVQRLLRNAKYGEALEHTLDRLSVAARFDQAAFSYIIDERKTQLPHDAWAHVCGLGFVNADEDGYYSFHRAVREALHAGLDGKRKAESIDTLLEHYTGRAAVKEILDVTDASVAALFEAAYLRRKLGAEGYVGWLSRLEIPVEKAARYSSSHELWQTALGFCQTAFGEQHNDTDASYNNLAFIMQAQGRYREAEPLYRKSLEISQNKNGEGHPSTATSYNNVGSNLNAQGRYTEAESLYRKGLEIRRKVLGEDHPSTATSYNNVGTNLNAQGRYADAEEFFRTGLDIKLKILPENHPSTATSYNNVAANLDGQGRYAEAEPLLKKGLEIKLRILPENHPSTAKSYNNVGYNLLAQGRYDEVEPYLRKALAILEKSLGPDHPTTQIGRKNLVDFLAAMAGKNE